jgi:hypothetical protein
MSYICILGGIDFPTVSTIDHFDFGIVRTVWYFFISLYHTFLVACIPITTSTDNIQIYDISIPLHGTDTQIIGGGVKHVLYAYTFPLRKNINEKLFHTFSIIRIKKKVKLITCFYSDK